MTKNVSAFRRIVTRCLAAGVLLCIYCFSVMALRRSCWPRQAQRLMPVVVVVAEVAVVAEEVVFAAVAFAAAVSVAAVFVAVAGDGVATQDRAAITAIAGVG